MLRKKKERKKEKQSLLPTPTNCLPTLFPALRKTCAREEGGEEKKRKKKKKREGGKATWARVNSEFLVPISTSRTRGGGCPRKEKTRKKEGREAKKKRNG